MGRFFGYLISIIASLVAIILIAPSFVEWNDYRTQIEDYAEDVTGRKISIGGDIGLVLLPSPQLSLEQLIVTSLNTPDQDQTFPLIDVERLEINAALSPILMGDIQVTDLKLIKPKMTLKRSLTNGNAASATERTTQVSDGGWSIQHFLELVVNAIQLEKVRIREGEITLIDQDRGVKEVLKNFYGTFSAQNLKGPMTLKGQALFHNVPIEFNGKVGDFSRVRSVPVTANINSKAGDASISFKGYLHQARFDGPFNGTLSINGKGIEGLHQLAQLAQNGEGAPLSTNWKNLEVLDLNLKTNLTRTDEAFNADELLLTVGKSRVTGEITAPIGNGALYTAKLSSQNLDLDAFIGNQANLGQWFDLKNGNQLTRSNQTDGSNQEEPPSGLILPNALRGTFTISVAGLTYQGALIRELELTGLTQGGSIIFDKVTAKLPGSANVKASGVWAPTPGGTTLNGELALHSANPYRTFDWLGLPKEALGKKQTPISYVGAFNFTPKFTSLSQAKVRLNGETVSGTLQLSQSSDQKVIIDLTAETFNANHWATLFGHDALTLTDILEFNAAADIKLDFDSLSLNGDQFKNVNVDAEIRDRKISISSLNFEDETGAKTSLAGTYQGPLATPTADLRGAIHTKNLQSYLTLFGYSNDLLNFERPADLEIVATTDDTGVTTAKANGTIGALADNPLSVGAQIIGKESVYNIKVEAKDEKTAININGKASLQDARVIYDLVVSANAKSWPALLETFGQKIETASHSDAAFSLSAKVEGENQDIEIAALSARAGQSEIHGDISIVHAPGKPTQENRKEAAPLNINADLQITNVDIDEFWPASLNETATLQPGIDKDIEALNKVLMEPTNTEPGFIGWLSHQKGVVHLSGKSAELFNIRFEEFDFTANMDEGQLKVPELIGKAYGGELNAQLEYDFEELVPELTSQFTLTNAELGLLTSVLFMKSDANAPATGTTTLEAEISMLGTNQQSMLSTLSGTGNVKSQKGILRGFDIVEFSQGIDQTTSLSSLSEHATNTLTKGKSNYKSLNGPFEIERGVLTVRSEKDSNGHGTSVSATLINSQTDDIEMGRFQLTGIIDIPAKVINGEGRIHLKSKDDADPAIIRAFGPFAEPNIQVDSSAMGVDMADEFAKRSPATVFTEEDKQIEMFRKGLESLENGE